MPVPACARLGARLAGDRDFIIGDHTGPDVSQSRTAQAAMRASLAPRPPLTLSRSLCPSPRLILVLGCAGISGSDAGRAQITVLVHHAVVDAQMCVACPPPMFLSLSRGFPTTMLRHASRPLIPLYLCALHCVRAAATVADPLPLLLCAAYRNLVDAQTTRMRWTSHYVAVAARRQKLESPRQRIKSSRRQEPS